MFPLQKFRFFLALPPPRCYTSPNPHARGCSSVGRAPALHAGGRRFDSVQLHPPPPPPSSPTSPPDMSSVTLRKPDDFHLHLREAKREFFVRIVTRGGTALGEDGFEQSFPSRRWRWKSSGFRRVTKTEAWRGGGGDGAGRSRTDGLLRAKQALCQLSYSPERGDWEKCSIGGEGARGKNGIFGAETWIFNEI